MCKDNSGLESHGKKTVILQKVAEKAEVGELHSFLGVRMSLPEKSKCWVSNRNEAGRSAIHRDLKEMSAMFIQNLTKMEVEQDASRDSSVVDEAVEYGQLQVQAAHKYQRGGICRRSRFSGR